MEYSFVQTNLDMSNWTELPDDKQREWFQILSDSTNYVFSLPMSESFKKVTVEW